MDLDASGQLTTRKKGIFYGWWIVAAGFLINVFGVGSFFYGFSAFFNPMIAEFGWSRTLMSGVFSLSRMEGGFEGPIAGWLIDKFGARRMLFIGISVCGLGFLLLRTVNSPLSLYLIFGLLVSLGFNTGFVNATAAAVAKWFIRKRGRAMSILITGNGVGGAIFVPLIAWLIIEFGWRSATTILGIGFFLIPLPLSLLIRSTPEDVGLLPDGESQGQEEALATTTDDTSYLEEPDYTVRQALKSRAFWIYVSSMMLRSSILSAIVVHQIPHLTDIGIPYQTAATVLGMMVLLSVPGRFVFGWLGDHFSKKVLLFALCLLQAVGIYIFINARTEFLLYTFVVVYGLGYGGVIPLTFALRADLFGRRNFATISGISMAFNAVGAVSAPLFAGYLYDTTQSYTMAFYVFIAMITASGFLFLLIPRTFPPKKSTL